MKKYENFFNDVYEVVRQIPKGRVTSYGAIAAYLGLKGSARMVGWAMNKNFEGNKVPAHRVVNRSGKLTGRSHFGDEISMQNLLEAEGIKIINDQIQDFDSHYWDPSKELEFK